MSEKQQERCPSRQGGTDWQCGLPKGHGGSHTALIPSGVPWASGQPVSPLPPERETLRYEFLRTPYGRQLAGEAATPERETAMRAATTRLVAYLQHLDGCEIGMTEFCTCGRREAIKAYDAALADLLAVSPETWRTAALLKDRTRRAIRDRAKAGESVESLAADYGVPVAFVTILVSWQMGADEPETGCDWREDEDGIWHTGCGTSFFFDTDGPEANKFRFCYHSGKTLKPFTFAPAPPAGPELK